MATKNSRKEPIIIHIDYDCFYASVIENQQPELREKPLGIQQKAILATCNYAARARGVKKLQLISEAKKLCPELVIVKGEDLTPFRDASKKIFCFVREYVWGQLVERLGFDEMFLDVTEMVDYNVSRLSPSYLTDKTGFFYLSENDDEKKFQFEWEEFPGYPYSPAYDTSTFLNDPDSLDLHVRLFLAGHFAAFLRQQILVFFNHTASSGISTSKIAAKLSGTVNKPNKQTVMVPKHLQELMDGLEIGKIPGVGHKSASALRNAVTGNAAISHDPFEEPKVKVTVKQVRENISREKLSDLLGRTDAFNVWCWIHGKDHAPLSPTSLIPTQLSIEDTFRSLTTFPEVAENLQRLICRLLERMRVDLLSADGTRWMGSPRKFRVSTSTRTRNYGNRISRSENFPTFALSLTARVEILAERFTTEIALPLMKRLLKEENEKNWDLWVINVAATNFMKGKEGMDIKDMFRWGNGLNVSGPQRHVSGVDGRQTKEVIKVISRMTNPEPSAMALGPTSASELSAFPDGHSEAYAGDSEDELCYEEEMQYYFRDYASECGTCGVMIPTFAIEAHDRYHALT